MARVKVRFGALDGGHMGTTLSAGPPPPGGSVQFRNPLSRTSSKNHWPIPGRRRCETDLPEVEHHMAVFAHNPRSQKSEGQSVGALCP